MSRLDLELLPGLALLTTYAALISPKAQKTTPGPRAWWGRGPPPPVPLRPNQTHTRLLRGDRVIPSTPAQLSPRPADPGPLSTRDLRPSRTFKMGLQPVLWIPFSGKLRVSPLLLGREPQGSIPALWADRAPLPSVPPHAPRAARESSSTPLRPGGPLGGLPHGARAVESAPFKSLPYVFTRNLGSWACRSISSCAHLGTPGHTASPGPGRPLSTRHRDPERRSLLSAVRQDPAPFSRHPPTAILSLPSGALLSCSGAPPGSVRPASVLRPGGRHQACVHSLRS